MKASRVFMFNGVRLADLDPEKKPDQIREMHANEHPELTTAKVEFKKVEGKDQYHFVKAAGTKG